MTRTKNQPRGTEQQQGSTKAVDSWAGAGRFKLFSPGRGASRVMRRLSGGHHSKTNTPKPSAVVNQLYNCTSFRSLRELLAETPCRFCRHWPWAPPARAMAGHARRTVVCAVVLAIAKGVWAQQPGNGPEEYPWAITTGKGGTNELFLKTLEAAQDSDEARGGLVTVELCALMDMRLPGFKN